MLQTNGGFFRIGAAAALMLLAAVAGGCASKVSEEARAIPVDPGPYPDFSRPLNSAMAQMTDEDAKKMDAQLTALGARRKSGAISQAEYNRRVEELRQLGATVKKPAPATTP